MSGRAPAHRLPRHAKSTQVSSVHGVLLPGQQKVLLVSDVLPYQSEDPLRLSFTLRAPWVNVDVPQWITLPVTDGSEAYLSWVAEETA